MFFQVVSPDKAWKREHEEKTECNDIKLPALGMDIPHYFLLQPDPERADYEIQDEPFEQPNRSSLVTLLRFNEEEYTLTQPGQIRRNERQQQKNDNDGTL